jgi:hypothetical protein
MRPVGGRYPVVLLFESLVFRQDPRVGWSWVVSWAAWYNKTGIDFDLSVFGFPH